MVNFGISAINRGYSNNTLYTNSLNTSDSNTDINQIGFVVVLKSNVSSNPGIKLVLALITIKTAHLIMFGGELEEILNRFQIIS